MTPPPAAHASRRARALRLVCVYVFGLLVYVLTLRLWPSSSQRLLRVTILSESSPVRGCGLYSRLRLLHLLLRLLASAATSPRDRGFFRQVR